MIRYRDPTVRTRSRRGRSSLDHGMAAQSTELESSLGGHMTAAQPSDYYYYYYYYYYY
jgi:hypothetical protein